MARTETMTYRDSLDSQYLTNSFSDLSRSRSTNSLIVRTYKSATQLYLTKRFKEALETLEPIISPQEPPDGNAQTNGDANGDTSHGSAPVAQSSRGTRTKVWVFYLSLLHAIIDLGQEEGRNVFGSARWRELASKAREGTIWEEVVRRGYGGEEGEVDADVVVNLATLLLGHMQDQRLNQQRLETYLSASEGGGVNGHLAFGQDGISTPMSNSSSSPKMLQTRLKILELYALHVLPANEEWDYASSFIEMNDMLDEERKEAFTNALQSLKEEKDGTAQRERDLAEERERELDQQRKEEEEARRAEEAQHEAEKRQAAEEEKRRAAATRPPNGNAATSARASRRPTSSQSSRPSKPQKKPPSPPPPNFYRRASSVFINLQQMVRHAGRNMNVNSLPLLRFLMFFVAFLLIVTRRDLRVKLRRAIGDGWVKVKQTVGMGVKVSYI